LSSSTEELRTSIVGVIDSPVSPTTQMGVDGEGFSGWTRGMN